MILISRREQLYSATVAKRQIQLQEMRDKLKEKHRKNDMIKLKKQLQFDSGYNVEGLATTAGGGGGTNDFFDDWKKCFRIMYPCIKWIGA